MVKYKYIIFTVIAFLLMAIGFFIGRKTIEEKEPVIIVKTEYIKGETVINTVEIASPPKIIYPDTLHLFKACIESGLYESYIPKDTVLIHDTLKIIATDWMAKKQYHEVLWDNDTTGTCIVDFNVQYNKVNDFTYTYIPIYKHIDTQTIIKKSSTFDPFMGVGILTSGSGVLTAGAYLKHLGVAAIYERNFNIKQDSYGLMTLVKF